MTTERIAPMNFRVVLENWEGFGNHVTDETYPIIVDVIKRDKEFAIRMSKDDGDPSGVSFAGRLTKDGIGKIINALRSVQSELNNPHIA